MSNSQDLNSNLTEEQISLKLRETQVLFRQQKYTEAKKILHDILKADPNNAAAYNNLGSIYLIRGRFSRAEKYFRKAVELDPALQDAKENLTTIDKMKKGKSRADVDREIAILEEEAKKLVQEKKLDIAIDKFKRILELDSTNVKIYNNLGILHFQKNDHEEAEKFFVKALEQYFLHGLAFDDQYTTIRENLNRLRKKIGSNVSDFMKTNFTSEIEKGLVGDEEVVKTFMGMMNIYVGERQIEVNTMLTLTNKRLIVYYKSSSVNNGEPIWSDFPQNQILDAKMVKGILKNTMSIVTPEQEYKVSSSHRKEMKIFLSNLKAIIKKRQAETTEQPVEVKPTQKYSESEIKIILRLLESLKDYKVLTPEEFESKKKMVLGGKKPQVQQPSSIQLSPFKRKGGIVHR